jgi:plasmid stability protein
MSPVRTTIRIEDSLYRRAKSRAAAGGRSMGEFIEDAIRDALEPSSVPPTELPDLPVHGGEGLMPGVDLSSHAAILDVMDEDVPLDARR